METKGNYEILDKSVFETEEDFEMAENGLFQQYTFSAIHERGRIFFEFNSDLLAYLTGKLEV